MVEITKEAAAALVPQMKADDNKYSRGVAELVVGEPSYAGAGVLAAGAASHMGAGYVRVYASQQATSALHVAHPACVCRPFETYSEDEHIFDEAHPRATAVGCGFAGDDASNVRVFDVLANTAAPVLVDGGGLAALALPVGKRLLAQRAAQGMPTVVTPHGGEASRLLVIGMGEDVPRYEDPAARALRIATEYGVVCVLKGPDTYIAAPEMASSDEVSIVTCGTAALAKAGTGDVLAGAIAALMAQGLPAKHACELGVYVHAQAGNIAADRTCALCVSAEDVVETLPYAMASLVK